MQEIILKKSQSLYDSSSIRLDFQHLRLLIDACADQQDTQ